MFQKNHPRKVNVCRFVPFKISFSIKLACFIYTGIQTILELALCEYWVQELGETWNFECKWPQIKSLSFAEEVKCFLAK